jgi:hypothetical protein
MNTNIFDRLSFFILFFVVVLLPIFFLPSLNIPIEVSKNFLLISGLTLSIVFWSMARFFDGQISFPRSKVMLAGVAVVFFTLLSAVFSSNYSVSFWGVVFDAGSFLFMFSGFLLFFVSVIFFKTRESSRMILLGLALSSAILLIFQSLHIFFPNFSSLGILTDQTSNVLGSWNSLGIFAGFSCLLYLFIVEFFGISKIRKILLYIMMLFSLFIVSAVNFSLVWCLLGITSLIIFVYKISLNFGDENDLKKKSFPVISLIVVLLSLFFFMSNQIIGNFIPGRLNLATTEINPSLKSTMIVAKGVLSQDPIFGIGPNRFSEAWNLYKSNSINDTQFWNVDFGSGFGFLPTHLSTNGALSLISWLVFVLLFIFVGIKNTLSGIKNNLTWESFAFFLLAVYLLAFIIFYPVSPTIFFLFLAFVGVFVGLLSSTSENKIQISFLGSQKKSFISVLLLIVLIIFSSALAFKYTEKFVSVYHFRKALQSANIEEAETYLRKAISLNSNDLYLRTFSQISILKLNAPLEKGGNLTEEEKTGMQTNLNQAISAAEMAVAYNKENYLNYQTLGNVYRNAVVLGIKDAYTAAISAYEEAAKVNPLNPGLKLAIADSYFSGGKITEAKEYANKALALKQDYVETLIFMSQDYKQEGNNKEALKYAEKVRALLPGDQGVSDYIKSLNSTSVSPTTETPKQ